MQWSNTHSPLVTSQDFKTSTVGMDESGMDKACAFLRDKIYSDKILAVVRETITNALDAHLKHGVDIPVKTGLRYNDQNKPEFYVRDFAEGLSDEDIREVFGMYFRSTKSGTNDFIGGFGLGAKAPSCYNDTFFVQSNYKGTRTLYMFAIGTNERGSSTVQILEIYNEPTTESGLEVYIEVQPRDVYIFDKKILNLVQYCDQPIEYHSLNNTIEIPLVPIKTVSKGKFTFKFFEKTQESKAPVSMRMGNVEYDTFDFQQQTIGNRSIMLDIPIGTMSLPISRESFEDTTANRRVREEIHTAFTEIIQNDASPFQGKSLSELVQNYEHKYVGELFLHELKDLYPNYTPFLSRLLQVNESVPAEKKDGRFLLALIPEIRTSNEWIGKLINSAKKYNKGFFYISEPQWVKYGEQNPEIADLFLAKKVRSRIFLPDLGNNNKNNNNVDIFNHSYNVRTPGKYRGSKTTKNVLQIHNHARHQWGLEEAEDINEAREQIVKMKESGFFDNVTKMNWFTYEKSVAKNEWWSISSIKQVEALKSLGWFDRYGVAYRNQHECILIKQKEEAEIQQYIKSALPYFIDKDYLSKMEKRLIKNTVRAKKMAHILNNIRKEDSFRGRMIRSLERTSYTYRYDHISRQDIREILKIK